MPKGTITNVSGGVLRFNSLGIFLPDSTNWQIDDRDSLESWVRAKPEVLAHLLAADITMVDSEGNNIDGSLYDLWLMNEWLSAPWLERFNGAASASFGAGQNSCPLDTLGGQRNPNSSFTESGNAIQVNFDGKIRVDYDCTIKSTGGGRTQVDTFVTQNNAVLAATRRTVYSRTNSHGSSSHGERHNIVVSNGDLIRIAANRVQGSGSWQFSANGSRLRVTRIV